MADAAKATPPPLLLLLLPPRATGSARSLGDWRRFVGGMERADVRARVVSAGNRMGGRRRCRTAVVGERCELCRARGARCSCRPRFARGGLESSRNRVFGAHVASGGKVVSDAAQSSVGGHPEQPRRNVGEGATRGSRRGSPQLEPPQHLRAVAGKPPCAGNTKTSLPPLPRFGNASRSDGPSPHSAFKTIAHTMARSFGASMARGLGILLIMMTLSEIAATRARRRL